jgi:sugar/nucleoside kinase (ribokinase family)
VTRADPTGAGDVFFAAYLAHRAGRAIDMPDAARAAAQFVSEFLLGRSP